MELNRRQLLGLAGAAVPAVMMFAAGEAPRASRAANLEVGAFDLRTALFFSSDFRSVVGIDFPGVLALRSLTAKSTRRIELNSAYDVRMFPARDSISLASGSFLDASKPALTRQDGISGGQSFNILLVPQQADWRELAVSPLTAPRELFPNDGIDDCQPVRLSVRSEGADVQTFEWLPKVLHSDGLAWGAALTAGWGGYDLKSEESRTYRYPQQVTIESVGPGELPIGTVIRISADSQYVASMAVDKVGSSAP